MNQIKPDYKKIFTDMVKYYELFLTDQIQKEIDIILSREELTSLDVLKMNELLFPRSIKFSQNQKLHKFDHQSKKFIIEYQKKLKLSNISTATTFKISRNTLAKWKQELE